MQKEKIIAAIQKLPDNASFEEIMDQIFLYKKVEEGLAQSKNGQVISDEELDASLPESRILKSI